VKDVDEMKEKGGRMRASKMNKLHGVYSLQLGYYHPHGLLNLSPGPALAPSITVAHSAQIFLLILVAFV
jgi:hypothetical protein